MEGTGGKVMYDVLFLLGVLVAWLLLQLVILPRLGFST
jgi:hypothetical protein